MKWLVLGANGQLGRSLSKTLTEREIPFESWGSKQLNIANYDDCHNLIRSLAPMVIINAAAWTDVDGAETNPEAAMLVNSIAPRILASIARDIGAVFAHVSTDYVFSGNSDHPWQESDERKPVSLYGKSKAEGEVAVLSEYLEGSYIFRTAWLYSEWGKNFAKTMTRMALNGEEEVRVVSDQVGQPTSAIDLANQIIDSINAKIPFGIYHGTNSGSTSWYKFAQLIFELAGQTAVRVVPVSSFEFIRPARRPNYSVLGHESWNQVGESGRQVAAMRNWKNALQAEMPNIIRAVKDECVVV